MDSRKQSKNVTFVGAVPHKEMYHYLQQADVFVSAPKVDNMPMSVLEAFNAGLLVISSNVGGVPFLVADNSTGYLFESTMINNSLKNVVGCT